MIQTVRPDRVSQFKSFRWSVMDAAVAFAWDQTDLETNEPTPTLPDCEPSGNALDHPDSSSTWQGTDLEVWN